MGIYLVKRKQIIVCVLLLVLICLAFFSPLVFSTTTEQTTPIYNYTIVLDAGHGGIDPGGIGITTKAKESELNLKVTNILKEYIKAFGVNVVLTRKDANGLYGIYSAGYKKRDMLERKRIIEECNADMVLSIHMNRFTRKSFRGAQAFYDLNSDSSQALALCIQNQFSKNIPASDKGISFGDYFMLKCTAAPSVICECGYLSNEEDEKLLVTTTHQDKVAYSIFCGIVEYLNASSSLS